MKYIVKPDEVVKFNETSGTLQNVDSINCVELSNTVDFENSVLLHPHRHVSFGIQLYARLYDNRDLPVELRVIPAIFNGGTIISGGDDDEDSPVATDAEFDAMLDDVFSGKTINDPDTDETFADSVDVILAGNSDTNPSTVSGAGGTVNIGGKSYNVASDDAFNSMLDELGL